MDIADFPIYKYPTKDVTDPGVLFQSLGSFWTQVFQDRDTIKGLTMAQALETTQRYKDLVEVCNTFSVKDIPALHTVDWFPIIIKRSDYRNAPLLFKHNEDSEVAYFGAQPAQDINNFYEGVIFKFGFPKQPSASVYTITMPEGLTDFALIADKIVNPAKIYVNGLDVYHSDDAIYFNRDIFEDPDIPKTAVIGEDGEQETFTNSTGLTFDEEIIILWAYQGKVDTDNLFENFGYIFDLKLTSGKFYKALLEKVFNLFVEGPTIRSLKSVMGAFLGVKPVIGITETIESIFTDTSYRYIVTDLNTYKFDLYYNLLDGIAVGAVVHAGDMLVDAVEYHDYVQSKNWWRHALVPKTGYAELDENGFPIDSVEEVHTPIYPYDIVPVGSLSDYHHYTVTPGNQYYAFIDSGSGPAYAGIHSSVTTDLSIEVGNTFSSYLVAVVPLITPPSPTPEIFPTTDVLVTPNPNHLMTFTGLAAGHTYFVYKSTNSGVSYSYDDRFTQFSGTSVGYIGASTEFYYLVDAGEGEQYSYGSTPVGSLANLHYFMVEPGHSYNYYVSYDSAPYALIGTFSIAVDDSTSWAIQTANANTIYIEDTLVFYPEGGIAQFPQMGFPNYMFLGNYEEQLVFKNEYELLTTDAEGNITFPIHGSVNDVEKFHLHLNESKTEIAEALGIGVSSALSLNPLDFIFTNFLKNNSALFKFNFKSIQQAQLLTSFFDTIKKVLPKYVYFVFFFDLTLDVETYQYLNFNDPGADGSNTDGQLTATLAELKTASFTGAEMFGLSKGLDYASSGNTEQIDCNMNHVKAGKIATVTYYFTVVSGDEYAVEVDAGSGYVEQTTFVADSDEKTVTVDLGQIPRLVASSDDAITTFRPSGKSTKDIPILRLLDFS